MNVSIAIEVLYRVNWESRQVSLPVMDALTDALRAIDKLKQRLDAEEPIEALAEMPEESES